ncbi:MAG: sulfite exporter TauE/SafE family protein [Gammaproteobacteria bacterium]|nr:sulfite exporter TauE/SafE family protein [Gammaproteobacteria bacterium]
MDFLAILAGTATGIVLGLFGSGGSIIATPALLYLLDVAPKSAIAMSLGIVAVTATIAALDNWKRGNVDVSVAAVFGLFGVAGTYAGARLGVVTPVTIQLTVFALVMYAAAWRMLKPALLAVPAGGNVSMSGNVAALPCTGLFSPCMAHMALHGIGVGVLTGFVGVGGGFLIVPALVLLSRIPMKIAVGTSLAIVAAKSYAGFAGYMGAVPIDWALMGGFTAVTVVASFVGTRIAHRFSQDALKRGFAVFLLFVASYILLKSVIGG